MITRWSTSKTEKASHKTPTGRTEGLEWDVSSFVLSTVNPTVLPSPYRYNLSVGIFDVLFSQNIEYIPINPATTDFRHFAWKYWSRNVWSTNRLRRLKSCDDRAPAASSAGLLSQNPRIAVCWWDVGRISSWKTEKQQLQRLSWVISSLQGANITSLPWHFLAQTHTPEQQAKIRLDRARWKMTSVHHVVYCTTTEL